MSTEYPGAVPASPFTAEDAADRSARPSPTATAPWDPSTFPPSVPPSVPPAGPAPTAHAVQGSASHHAVAAGQVPGTSPAGVPPAALRSVGPAPAVPAPAHGARGSGSPQATASGSPQTQAPAQAQAQATASGSAASAPGSHASGHGARSAEPRSHERWAQRAAHDHGSCGDAELERAGDLLDRVTRTYAERVVGQDQLRIALVSTLIAGGHILLESVPGLAKTTAAQTLAAAVSGSFRRIQCTPDLMPNDIVGTQILNYQNGEMTTQLGPVHANIVLLDEINRSSAKTQSAMLEAMQERQTSIGGVVYPLPQPFMVLATQNPIEEEGTYVLPEAQMDRFLLKEVLTYPRPAHEMDILDRVSSGAFDRPLSTTAISPDDVLWLQRLVERVYVDPVVKQFIVALVNTTRGGGPRPIPGLDRHVRVGASPRGGIALMKVAQAIALQAGRTYVTPDDVKLLRHGVLRHRIVRTYDALADDVAPEALIDAVFAAVPTP